MTGRMWVAVGAICATLMVCTCVVCTALVAVYPMPPSYYATSTARAWATRSATWTATAHLRAAPATPGPTPTPRPSTQYVFSDGCGDPRTTEPFQLRDGEVEFTWDQGGTGVFGMRLVNVATEDSRIIVGPISGHMAGWETVHVAAGSYRLRIWCYATDFNVYVAQ